MRKLGLLLAVALGVGGCQMTLPHPFAAKPATVEAVDPTAITGGQIETSSLDAPKPAVGDAAGRVVGAQAAAETAAAPPEEKVVVKSALQLDCEKTGGTWAVLMAGGAFCQKMTKDSGKRCRAAGDCEGACLARSLTCAPATPLLGCQTVMDSEGRAQEQCIN